MSKRNLESWMACGDGKKHFKKSYDDVQDDEEKEDDYDEQPIIKEMTKEEENALIVIHKALNELEAKNLMVRRWELPVIFAPYLKRRIFDLLAPNQKVTISSNEHGFELESDCCHDYEIELKGEDIVVTNKVSFRTGSGKFYLTFQREVDVMVLRAFLGELS
jgi:hypothetical protein